MLLLCLACTPANDSTDKPIRDLRGEDTAFDSADTAWDTAGDTGDSPIDDECPAGVICLTDFPAADANTTVGGSRDFDGYSCASDTDESGPEVVYRLTLDEPGFLSLDLRDMDSGADVDVHLLDARDADRCIDRGHWAAAAWVDAGTYWVVADSWVSGDGAEQSGGYELLFGHLTVDELRDAGMEKAPAALALAALDRAWDEGHTEHVVHGFIDFSIHSSEERLWIWDTAAEELLHHLHVTHGENSSDPNDRGYAVSFSNENGSHQSSLGMMLTAEDYSGSNGHSMRMDGLEDGYNDAVRPRAIVVHGASYARPEYVDSYGRLGQSWGCPAVDDRETESVLADLQGGFLWSYYPDGDWSERSVYLP
ncbi:MAG: murein L,D-transpeptidase catalytic domain family protein [Proteobacteria bacterium]|nr:murein L,D-transpeptidase catalytic domain family protein [Pseudomonadota bacterium]MCP4922311.1 murein L,D-transpeptidase catalytic domain family protein [Pseudomonadota bacterium]